MPYTPDWTLEAVTRAEVDSLAGATLLEFGTDWCPHCQAAQPALREALSALPGVRHVKIEDGRGRLLGRSFGVKVWPNFVLLRDGQLVGQLARPEPDALLAALRSLT
jgi:thioredoxin 1